MGSRAVLGVCLALVVAAACGGQVPAAPLPAATPPTAVAGLESIPPGPILFEPEQLILPPEEFPVAGAQVASDSPIIGHGWERQFATSGSRDFKWFTLRLFLLDPDVPAASFIAGHGCEAIRWDGEAPVWKELDAMPSGDGARACRYEFSDGLRVLYHTTGFRNLGIVVGMQPRRAEVTDQVALEWLAVLATQQILVVGRVLKAAPKNGSSGGG